MSRVSTTSACRCGWIGFEYAHTDCVNSHLLSHRPTTTTSVADLKRRLDQLESSMNKRQKSDSHEGPVAVSPVVSTTTTGSGTIGRMPQRSSPWEAQRSPEAAVRPKGFPLASAGALEEMREQIDLEMSTNSARSGESTLGRLGSGVRWALMQDLDNHLGSPDTDWQMSRGLSPSQSQDRDAASHRNTNRPVHRRPPSGSGEEKSDLSVIDTMVEPGLAKRLFDQYVEGVASLTWLAADPFEQILPGAGTLHRSAGSNASHDRLLSEDLRDVVHYHSRRHRAGLRTRLVRYPGRPCRSAARQGIHPWHEFYRSLPVSQYHECLEKTTRGQGVALGRTRYQVSHFGCVFMIAEA